MYLYIWYTMKNKQTSSQEWWEKKHLHEDKNTVTWPGSTWNVQDIQVQKNIIDTLNQDTISKELMLLMNVLDNKKEVFTIMKQSIESGMLNIQDAKAYTEINGQKGESILFNTIKNTYGTAQAILTWLQVRTKQFKDWFGDWQTNLGDASKVVDKQGEPLVMFRGDAIDKEYFEKRDNRANKYGNWIYVTKNYAIALSIAQTWHKNPTVYPVFVKSLHIKSYPKSILTPNHFFLKDVGNTTWSTKKDQVIVFTDNLHKQGIDLDIDNFVELNLAKWSQVKSTYSI